MPAQIFYGMHPKSLYNIPFVGLSLGKHTYEFDINNKFFEWFQYNEIDIVHGLATVILDKKNTFFELEIAVNGKVNLICDISNELFSQDISNSMELIVKFGENYNDEDDKIIIIPHEAFEINVAQYIYETIMLAIPMKKIHPGVADGTLESPVLKKLQDYTIQPKQETDPRWEQLNHLLTQKKQ